MFHFSLHHTEQFVATATEHRGSHWIDICLMDYRGERVGHLNVTVRDAVTAEAFAAAINAIKSTKPAHLIECTSAPSEAEAALRA